VNDVSASPEDLTRCTAAQLSALLADSTASAREVASAHLDRIEAVDPEIHAFLHVDRQGALSAADAVDTARAEGAALGPLAGVPLALKDVLTMRAHHLWLAHPAGLAPAL
jgi:aspartyl-tRNA(Asn)/glutamyl-tRNA(Gln) amidotransferase subunit A